MREHEEIERELVKLYGFGISDSGVSKRNRGIDLYSGEDIGIEVKTFPRAWREQLQRYKKEYRKIILVLEVPDIVDEVYIYRKGEIAKKVKEATSIAKKFLDWVVKKAYDMTRKEICKI